MFENIILFILNDSLISIEKGCYSLSTLRNTNDWFVWSYYIFMNH